MQQTQSLLNLLIMKLKDLGTMMAGIMVGMTIMMVGKTLLMTGMTIIMMAVGMMTMIVDTIQETREEKLIAEQT